MKADLFDIELLEKDWNIKSNKMRRKDDLFWSVKKMTERGNHQAAISSL